MKATLTQALAAFVASLLAFGTAQAQQDPEESFFSIPEDALQSDPNYAVDRIYLATNAFERLADYDAVMVDQPEVWLHEDSKYKGLKPDDLKILADTWREAVVRELYGNYDVVEMAGPNVLQVRLAVRDLFMKKQRGILSFTPIGAVTHAIRNAATDDIMKKISLIGFGVEVEVVDSVSGDVLAAVAERRSDTRQAEEREPASWTEVRGVMTDFGMRLGCRLDNARKPDAEQVDCRALVAETADE